MNYFNDINCWLYYRFMNYTFWKCDSQKELYGLNEKKGYVNYILCKDKVSLFYDLMTSQTFLCAKFLQQYQSHKVINTYIQNSQFWAWSLFMTRATSYRFSIMPFCGSSFMPSTGWWGILIAITHTWSNIWVRTLKKKKFSSQYEILGFNILMFYTILSINQKRIMILPTCL